jgi:hypothetical protein
MEIRVGRGYRSVEDVEAMIKMMVQTAAQWGPSELYVIAADWRAVSVMTQPTATSARGMLARSNARVLRSSILTLPAHSTANLQVRRLLREADNENRKHFVDAREQHRWLSEVLTSAESERLSSFLGLKVEPSLA